MTFFLGQTKKECVPHKWDGGSSSISSLNYSHPWTVRRRETLKCSKDQGNSIQKIKMNYSLVFPFECIHYFVTEAESMIELIESI